MNAVNPVSTGLPELPDNLFWRVGGRVDREDGVYLSFFGGRSPNNASVSIMEPYTVWEVPKNKKGKFKKNAEPVEVHKERTLHYEWVTVTEDYEVNVLDEDDELKGVKTKTRVINVTPDNITPELVLETAQKALDRYNEILVARSYLGDYPPKNLDDVKASEESARLVVVPIRKTKKRA